MSVLTAFSNLKRMRLAWLRLLCLAGMPILVTTACTAQSPPSEAASYVRIVQAQASKIVGDFGRYDRFESEQMPPSRGKTIQTVSLPDAWNHREPGFSGTYLYEITFNLAPQEKGKKQALYIPKIGNRFHIWINEKLVKSTGDLSNISFDNANVPNLIEIPNAYLNQGSNQLAILVAGERDRMSGLSSIYIGRYDVLIKHYDWRQFVQVLSTWLIISISAAMALVAWLINYFSKNNFLFIFGLGSLAWALRSAFIVTYHTVIDYRYLLFIFDTLYGVAIACLLLSVQSMYRLKQTNINRLLYVYLISTPVCAAIFALGLPYARSVFLVFSLLIVIVFFSNYLYKIITKKTKISIPLTLSFVVAIAFGAYDQIMVYQYKNGYELSSLSKYSYIIICLTLSVSFGFKLHKINLLIRSANQRANRRLALTRARLAKEYGERAKFDQQRLLAAERWRVMQDMHDGLGGQLITLQKNAADPSIDRKKLAMQVKDALDNLRMTVYALGQTYTQISFLLGDLRERLDDLCLKFDKQLIWQVNDTPDTLDEPVMRLRHLEKMLLEIFTNIAKYSDASTVTLSTQVLDNNRVAIVIKENGSGFDVHTLILPTAQKPSPQPQESLHKGWLGLQQRATLSRIEMNFNHNATSIELVV